MQLTQDQINWAKTWSDGKGIHGNTINAENFIIINEYAAKNGVSLDDANTQMSNVSDSVDFQNACQTMNYYIAMAQFMGVTMPSQDVINDVENQLSAAGVSLEK